MNPICYRVMPIFQLASNRCLIWVNGEFNYIISKKSSFKEKYITALSTRLYSVIGTILPPGYGFCIIDEDGGVQVHSDLNRSLNENFLEQAAPALPLREAIASRQNMSFNEIKFYGKPFAVNIKPVSRLPFFLVTFYDKGYIVPVNMRILIFSLILCFAFYTVLLLLWFFAIRKKHYANPLLYSPMDVLHWVVPKQHAVQYYRRCYKFLAAYICALLLVVFAQAKFTSLNSNYFCAEYYPVYANQYRVRSGYFLWIPRMFPRCSLKE